MILLTVPQSSLCKKTPRYIGNSARAELHKRKAEAQLTINMSKTNFMKKELLDPVLFEGAHLEEGEDYVYLGRLLNMKNDLRPKISRRKITAWAAYNSVRGVVESCSDCELRANIFISTVFPALY
ncbi:unnamed protein product [Heligmosomoides polygyrus]|uniref:NTR domain-containing protein n=1 Tax=Heligmosomoides polygyrus TaxID=6339 RepID=A0A183GE13_HELPZ|nr:unnamed protein product [Heligmosomoides polygyrus]